MKKLMFTLIVVALSGSSLFGIIPAPERLAPPSGTTAFMYPALDACLKRKEYTTPEEAQQALAECQKEIGVYRVYYDQDQVR